uniref:Ig-like domain-containing protein n=1 Tax=Leptobrachium leishanense TaxID=445787 RepID=A0A8C5PND3_9ANUR
METRILLLLLFLHQTVPAGGVLKLVAPTFHRARMGSDVLIPCRFTIDKPPLDTGQLGLSWRFQDVEILTYNNKMSSTQPRASINTERIKDGDVSLYISNTTISDGGIYTCLMSYSAERQDKEIRLDIEAPPQITINRRIAVINRQSVLRATITGFYPVDINVKWFRDGEILNNYTVSTPQRNLDGTYSVSSTVTIMPTEEDKHRTFSCRVQHESLSGPLQEDFHLIYGVVPILEIPSSTFYLNKKQELVCHVWGFYPESINVNWFLNGSLVDSTETRRISSSAMDAIYKFTPTEKNQGLELSCEVEHDTLSRPLVRKLLVEGKDLSVKHRVAVGVASFVTMMLAAVAIFLVYHHRHKKRKMPRVREITRCGDGTFSLDVDHFRPKDISFSWHLIQPPSSTEKQQLESTLIMSENQDRTFNATSTCDNMRGKVNVTQPYTIQAAVTHPRLKQPVCKEWTSDPQDGYKLRPIVTRPLQLSLCDHGDVLCSLNLETFYPKHIDISWRCDTGQSQKDISSQEKYPENPDQSYNAESACKIPGDSLKDPEFKVIVRWKHETMEDWESRELRVRDPGFPWRPNITDMSPLIVQSNQQTTLKCTVSGYFPDVLTVMWFMKNARQETIPVSNGSKYEIPEISQEKMSDNTYTCTSTLCFTPTSNSEEQEFICRVSHPSLEKPIERSTGEVRWKVSPTVTEPIKFSLCESGDVLCSLYVSKFYPQNINIIWTSAKDQINKIKSTKKIIQIDDEKTYDAISECRIKWDQSLFLLRVTWNHESMEKPEYKELRITDLPWIPSVGEIFIPSLRVGSERTMTCDINNYFPVNKLTVTWFKEKGGERETLVSSSDLYQIPALRHVKQQDHTYSCTAGLGFTPRYESDHEAVFICMVQHPSLEGAIERRTEPLQVMVAPVVPDRVNLTLCDTGEVLCVLKLTRFYPEDINITWSSAIMPNGTLKSDETPQPESDHLHSVISQCKIPWRLFQCSVRVTWHHVSLDEPGHRELHITDLPWIPAVGEISVPALRAGSECTMTCDINNYFPDNNLTVTWLKKAKDSIEWVNVTNYYDYKIPDLQHEKQQDLTYSCTARLIFTPSHESDDGAVFICMVQHPNLEPPIGRRTEPLHVMVAPVVADPVNLTLCDTGEVLCVLTLTRFYPEDINITWNSTIKPDEILKSDETPQHEGDHLHSVISRCRIPWDHFQHSVTVTWHHVSLDEPGHRELRITDLPWIPAVGEISVPALCVGSECTMTCDINNYFPDNKLTVTWYREQGGRGSVVSSNIRYNSDLQYVKQQDHTYSCTAPLDFTPTYASDQGAVFICVVEHPSLKGAIERRTKPLQVMVAPVVVDPVILTLCDTGEVLCVLKLTRFYPRNIEMSWNSAVKPNASLNYNKEMYQYESDHLYNVRSQCKIPLDLFQDSVWVTWRHVSLDEPGHKELHITDFPWRPVLGEMKVPTLREGAESKLQCKISGYFPNNLTVSWLKKVKGGNEWVNVTNYYHYKIPDLQHKKQRDHTYSCKATLVFTPSLESDHGAEFICRVEHPSLEEPIERRTEPLQVNSESIMSN